MRWACVAVFLAAAVAAADDKPKDDAKKDLEPLQGTWSVVKIVQDGKELPGEAVEGLTLVVKGNSRVLKQDGEEKSKATFKVDPTKKPKAIDIEVSDGPLAGRTIRGVYEVKDDTLRVCLAIGDDERPDGFEAKEGSGRQLQEFKKQKKDKDKDAGEKPAE